MSLLRAAATMLTCALVSACTTTASFYPIEGPLSQQVPAPVLVAKVDGIMGNTGGISMLLPNGERCEGRWSSIAPMSVNYSSGSASGYATNGMDSVWAQVYGSGFSIRNLAGVNRGEAVLVGNMGTTIQVEFYTGSGTANGSGVARDNKGNLFKVLF